MVANELPNNKHSLKLLFKQTEKLLSDLEPIRQKITPLPLYVQKMIKGNLNHSDEEYYRMDIAALQNAYPNGIQIRGTIKDYLEQDDTIQQNQDLPDAMQVLDDLVESGNANAEEIKNFQRQSELFIVEKCAMISRATNMVGQLQKQILDKLEKVALPRNTPSHLKKESFEETDGANVVGNQTSAPAGSHKSPSSLVRTAKKSTRIGPVLTPQPDFENWGIGIDHNSKWQYFECHEKSWRHKGVMDPQPAKRLQMELLQVFIERGPTLDRTTIVKVIGKKATDSENLKWYRNTLKPTISMLRTCLRTALKFDTKDNPIRWEKSSNSYSLFIRVGAVLYENGKYIFECKKLR